MTARAQKPTVLVYGHFETQLCALFLDTLGANSVMFSFFRGDECIHTPSESQRLSSFDRGLQAYGRMLQELAEAALQPLPRKIKGRLYRRGRIRC